MNFTKSKYGPTTFQARGCVWTDTTSYSRDDKERVPDTFSAQVGPVKITVTNGHIYHRPEFVFHCFALKIDTVAIDAKDHQDAAEQAFDLCHTKAFNICEAFRRAIEAEART